VTSKDDELKGRSAESGRGSPGLGEDEKVKGASRTILLKEEKQTKSVHRASPIDIWREKKKNDQLKKQRDPREGRREVVL